MHTIPAGAFSAAHAWTACCAAYRGHPSRAPLSGISRPHQGGPLYHCDAGPWRPLADDVDRLARGEGARRRGTGSFHIPHRLNADERPKYAAAKSAQFLAVAGKGYRRERRGHPLPNIWRQWCDAKALPCIVVQLDVAGTNPDVVVVDLSTLRLGEAEAQAARQQVERLAQCMGVQALPAGARGPDSVPFDTILLPVSPSGPAARKQQRRMQQQRTQLSSNILPGASAGVHPSHLRMMTAAEADASSVPEHQMNVAPGETVVLLADELSQSMATSLAEAQHQAEAAAQEVRHLKEVEGWPNSAQVVQQAIAHMKQLREHAEQLQRQASGAPLTRQAERLFSEFDEGPGVDEERVVGSTVECDEEHMLDAGPAADELRAEAPQHAQTAIWGVPPAPVFFAAPRAAAKAFAGQVAKLELRRPGS